MKKLLFAGIVTLATLSSCVSVPQPMFTQSATYLDYYEVGLNGKILLTESNSYSGEYISMGSIVVTERSGVKPLGSTTKQKVKFGVDDDVYGSQPAYETVTTYKKGDYKYATFRSALVKAVNVAEEMGGNAIINLKLQRPDDDTVIVSGMVIKRQ